MILQSSMIPIPSSPCSNLISLYFTTHESMIARGKGIRIIKGRRIKGKVFFKFTNAGTGLNLDQRFKIEN